MKPKKQLTEINARIVVKNPFSGTIVAYLKNTSEPSVQNHISQLYYSISFDYSNLDEWKKWIEQKHRDKWSKRKIINFIKKYFEVSDKEGINKLIEETISGSPLKKYIKKRQKGE